LSTVIRLHADAPQQTSGTAVFVQDDITRATIAEVLKDAQPAVVIKKGNIESAIEHISHDPSPRNIVVDLTAVEEPLDALDRLAEVCMPDTRVIALGDINDIQFYRMLRSAGVAEYLVKPVTAQAVKAALTLPVADRPETTPPKPQEVTSGPVAVIGARGGVGATMVAVALAWLSAERKRRRTVLVDLDIAYGSASLALDVQPGHGLSEALASPERIDGLLVASATVKLGKHLYLLSSEQPLDGERPSQADSLRRLVVGLGQSFQHIIFDVPRADPVLLRQSIEQARVVLIVTDFSLAGVRDTKRLSALVTKLGPTARLLIVGNRVADGKKGGLSRAEIEKAIGAQLVVAIPEDSAAVSYALNAGKPLPAAHPSSKTTAAIQALADAIEGVKEEAKPGILARVLTVTKRESAKS
jgi:pilus assembly protein CpaE